MKKVFALILVLVLALAAFSSCAKKEEPKEAARKEATLKYTVYNRTGEVVSTFSIKDLDGTSETTARDMEKDLATEVSVLALVDETGTPNLQVAFTTAGTNGALVGLNTKTDSITLLPGGISFEAPKD